MKINIIFVIFLIQNLITFGQYNYVQKKVDVNRNLFDAYGNSVDIQGDFAVVGMLLDDEDELEQNTMVGAGSVIVYKKDYNGNWNLFQKIVAPDRYIGAGFGTSVKINGNQIIISAFLDATDELSANPLIATGSVYVYELISNSWTFVQKIVAPDRAYPYTRFGYSLDIDDNLMIVGSISDRVEADGVTVGVVGGSAYFYEKDNTGSWNFAQKVVPSDKRLNDRFGGSVSITSQGRAVVGAPRQDYDENNANFIDNAGAAYIYEKTGTTWNFVQKKVLPGRITDDEYGFAVAIDDDRITVGAPRHAIGTNVVGKVEVFDRVNSTTWNSMGTIISNVTTVFSYGAFGTALEMEGDKLFVGAPLESSLGGIFKGNLYYYEKDPSGTAGYNSGTPITPTSHSIEQTVYGMAIAVDGDNLIVGALGDMTDENNQNPIPFTNPPGAPDTDSVGAVHFFFQCTQANVPQISASSSSICIGDSVQLVISSSSNLNAMRDWYWYTGSYSTGTLIDSTDTIWVHPTTTTTYSVAGEGYCINPNSSDSVGTITINVNPPPNVIANASPNDTLCIGDSVTLFGTGANTYAWSSSVANGVAFLPPAGTSTYILTGTDNIGCENKDTIIINVFPPTNITSTVSPSNNICFGDSILLRGVGGVSYVWDSAGIDVGIINNTYYIPPTGNNITYTVTGTDANGCVDTSTQTINVNPSPNVSITSSAGGTNLCEGDSLQLTATGTGQSYLWSNGIIDGAYFIPTVGTNTYTVIATGSNGCNTKKDTIIVVNPKEDATITPISTICESSQIQNLVSVTTGGVWQGTGIDANTGAFNPETAGVGNHQIIYTTSGTCNDSDTINIQVHPKLSLVKKEDSVCFGEETGIINVTATGTSPYNYLWSNNETTSEISGLGEGTYSVLVTDANNCSTEINVNVYIVENCEYNVFLPNIFSPNNDGNNDVFYTRGKGFKSLKFIVFDRWGNKMFETTDKNKGWDGRYKGNLVEAGVYVYYVEVEYYNNKKEVVEGNVCVIF